MSNPNPVPSPTSPNSPASLSDEEIFAAALQVPTAAERRLYLEQACGGRSDQLARVEALLAALDDAGSFLNRPVAELGLGATVAHGAATGNTSQAEATIPLDFLSPADDSHLLGKLGPYLIEEVIGRGGMGIVLRAIDPKLNRVVAIKVLAPELARNPMAGKRFLREAQAAAAVSHDHVVRIYAVDDDAAVPYLVMECIIGQSLQQKIERQGILETREILRIGYQMASGLAAAHKQGLVHRDIKPANILLENGIERVKITDFGLARAVDDVGITQTGQVTGTPQYMSPEQAMGEPVDHRSDLFSLGSVLYTMCTGRPAFRATSTVAVLRRVVDDTPRPIREMNPEAPDWLIAIIDRLMAKQPGDRFQTAAEVASLLEQWLAHFQRPQSIPAPSLPIVPALELPVVNKRAVKPVGTLRRAWDEWWSERDRWVAISVQSMLVVFHLLCMMSFLNFFTTQQTKESLTHFQFLMGAPWPWYRFEINPGIGMQQSFQPFTWSVLIGMIGLTAYYIVWRIEKARDPQTSWWNRPELLMSFWGLAALAGVVIGNLLAYEVMATNRAQKVSGKSLEMLPKSVGTSSDVPVAITSSPATIGAAPPLAIAPFDETQARAHQAAWARHLGVPVAYTNSIGLQFQLIPPGENLLGSTSEQVETAKSQLPEMAWFHKRIQEELPQRLARISTPYYLGTFELTQDQFARFVDETGYVTELEADGMGGKKWDNSTQQKVRRPEYTWRNQTITPSGAHPVCWLTVKDTQAFCTWLSTKEKLHYSLPSNEQWEFACRAGTVTPWHSGDDPEIARQFGVFTGDVARVGTKRPNPFGMFDMHGNMVEVTCEKGGTAYERSGGAGLKPWCNRSASISQLMYYDNVPLRDRGFRIALQAADVQRKIGRNPGDATMAINLEGRWETHWGPVILQQPSTKAGITTVVGTYYDGMGQIEGTFDPATRTFRGRFHESNGMSGLLQFVVSGDELTLFGTYAYRQRGTEADPTDLKLPWVMYRAPATAPPSSAAQPPTAAPQVTPDAVLVELRKQVELAAAELETARAHHMRQTLPLFELKTAEQNWNRAKLRLAAAEGNRTEAILSAQILVQLAADKLQIVRKRIEAQVGTTKDRHAAEQELSQARQQLAELRPDAPPPPALPE